MDPIAMDQDYWVEGDSDLSVSSNSSEDEFGGSAKNLTESDIENEVNRSMEALDEIGQQPTNSSNTMIQKGGVSDKDFLSSDSEDEPKSAFENAIRKASKVNECQRDADNFYDPDLDDKDEDWVRQRRCHNFETLKNRKRLSSSDQPHKPSSSDAVLNCPACMTTLCVDCQRHDTYKTQYRAMFVLSCKIANDEPLRYEIPQSKQTKHKRRNKKRKHQDQPIGKLEKIDNSSITELSDDTYYRVKCEECNTEVAVYDRDEIYHFYNIIASYA